MLVLGVMFIVFLLLMREVHERADPANGMPPHRRGRKRRTAPALMVLEDGVLVRADLVAPRDAEPRCTEDSLSMRGHRWVSILFAQIGRRTRSGPLFRVRREPVASVGWETSTLLSRPHFGLPIP